MIIEQRATADVFDECARIVGGRWLLGDALTEMVEPCVLTGGTEQRVDQRTKETCVDTKDDDWPLG